MKTLLMGLAIVMSAALPAVAESWVYVSESSTTTLYIDNDSVALIHGGYSYKEIVTNKRDGKVLLSQSQMLCSERQIRKIAYNFYEENGELIKSYENLDEPFRSIKIETTNAELWQKLCN